MSADDGKQTTNEVNYVGSGFAIGIAIGVALGVLFGLVLDNMAFMGIGIAIGTSLGLVFGRALNEANKQEDA